MCSRTGLAQLLGAHNLTQGAMTGESEGEQPCRGQTESSGTWTSHSFPKGPPRPAGVNNCVSLPLTTTVLRLKGNFQ